MPFFDRYFQLLEALGQAVIVTDAEGTIVHWSDSAARLYGWSADEVLGRDVLEVTPSDVSRARGAEIMRSLAAGEVWSGEFAVRGRDGRPFTVSVTDVPLLSNDGALRIVGVSAPSHAPTDLRALAPRFVSACESVWPGRIQARIEPPPRATVAASEPHLIQLLSLLMMLYIDALEEGGSAEIVVGPANESIFAEFGLGEVEAAAYIRIGRSGGAATYSVLRNVPRSAEPTRYAAALVRMVRGMLIAGASPAQLNAMHLFLPAS
jgi:PAS domain S-box-containing protein